MDRQVAAKPGIELLMADGMTIKDIAQALGLTPATIRRLAKGGNPSTATWQRINFLIEAKGGSQ